MKTTPARNAGPSIIIADLKIVGDLSSAVDIQSRSVTIGEAALVTGSISGDTVRVCGSVNGQIKGQTVTLDKTAKVNGDIHHQSLAIEPGAFLEGHCKRIDSKPAAVSSVSSSSSTGSSASSLTSSASTAPAAPSPSITSAPQQYAS